MSARETKHDVAECDPVHSLPSSHRIGSRGILASSMSPSRLKQSRQADGKRRFERRVQVRVLVHEVLEFRFRPGNVARRLDRHDIGRCRLFRHVADAADEMSGLEFGNVAAVDLGTGLARVDQHEAVQRLVALDEALACLGVFPGCQLEQLDHLARRHGSKDELAQSLLIRAQIHGKALQQQSTDPVDVQGRKHEIPIDGCHQWLGGKEEIWDKTSGSNDGEYPEPQNVTYHEGEEIKHIGYVYQKINLERHLPIPLAVDRRCAGPKPAMRSLSWSSPLAALPIDAAAPPLSRRSGLICTWPLSSAAWTFHARVQTSRNAATVFTTDNPPYTEPNCARQGQRAEG